MTHDDLQQLRELMREEIAVSTSMLREEIAASEQRTAERQGRAVETIGGEISRMRQEFSERMDLMQQRLSNFASTLFAIDQRTAAQGRAVDGLPLVHERDAGTLAAITRDREQLAARLKALEEKASGRLPPEQP